MKDQEYVIYEDNFNGSIGIFKASDPDAGQILTYSIIEGNTNQLFKIDSRTGMISVPDPSLISFTTTKEYSLTIKVSDNATLSKYATGKAKITFISSKLTFFIDPENSNDPLEDGTYDHPYNSWKDVPWMDGRLYLQKSGTTANEDNINIGADNITLSSYGNGNAPIISSNTTTYPIRVYNKKNITIRNIGITAPQAQSCIYFLGETCENITIEKCILKEAKDGVLMVNGKNFLIRYNNIHVTGAGIYSMADNADIYYNIFSNSGTAIDLTNYPSRTNIYNNVFYGNAEGIASSGADLTLYNNIFYLSKEGAQAVNIIENNHTFTSDNNIYYPEQSAFMELNYSTYNTLEEFQQIEKKDLNSLNSNPFFINAAKDNFNVEVNSPAINKGRNVGLTKDFYGFSVPSGGIPDIGIAEITYNSDNNNNTIAEVPQKIAIAYPNPTSGLLNIQLTQYITQSDEQTELDITDITGKNLYHNFVNLTTGADFTVDLSGLGFSPGVYILILNMGKERYTEKIILQ